jgi:acyl-coenzyme A thioesterase PaaI-like protein
MKDFDAAPMCFACGQDNPDGLKITFSIDENNICSGIFTANNTHVGYQNTVHGGIIYAALDDVMANVLYLAKRKAYTAKCEIRYRKSLEVGQTIKLKGWIEKEKRRLIILKGEARLKSDDTLIADCDGKFMLV